ncbi:MAG: 16S rRNA (uracil(1498)-N(3))-methyltransferase [Dokdonella sp.]
MRVPRIHVATQLEPRALVELPAPSVDYLAKVLRLEAGHPLRVFNGDGLEYDAEITTISKRGAQVRLTSPGAEVAVESRLRITLAQGVARGEKMDWIVQKAVELGVHRIVPIITERTEVKLDAVRAERRVAHWQAVAISACEQCGRAVVPVIATPVKLVTWAASLADGAGLRLSLDPKATTSPRSLSLPHNMATLAIGPEGGLATNDLAVLAAANFVGMRLGPRILRTETAGIVAISALQTLYGDLG